MWKRSTAILGVLLTGVVAGTMFGTGGSLYGAWTLASACWTASFQTDDAIFERVMTPLFLLTTIVLLAGVLGARSRARVLQIVCTGCFLVAIAITLLGNVPINLQVRSWTPEMIPADWEAVRDRWLWIHLARAVAAVTSFAASIYALKLSASEAKEQKQ